MRSVLSAALLLSFAAPVFASAETREALQARLRLSREPRILFVGNSYSFAVPKAFAELAKQSGRRLVVEQATAGGWTLKKHAEAEATLQKIRKGQWDVVVLQEQSQLPSFSKGQREKEMIPHAKSLAEEARRAGAIPVFFLTWGRREGDKKNAGSYPDDSFAAMQKRLETGYADAAAASGAALVVPVGPAWAKEMEKGEGKALYQKDGSHPSAAGVRLAATVFMEFFFGKAAAAQ